MARKKAINKKGSGLNSKVNQEQISKETRTITYKSSKTPTSEINIFKA